MFHSTFKIQLKLSLECEEGAFLTLWCTVNTNTHLVPELPAWTASCVANWAQQLRAAAVCGPSLFWVCTTGGQFLHPAPLTQLKSKVFSWLTCLHTLACSAYTCSSSGGRSIQIIFFSEGTKTTVKYSTWVKACVISKMFSKYQRLKNPASDLQVFFICFLSVTFGWKWLPNYCMFHFIAVDVKVWDIILQTAE